MKQGRRVYEIPADAVSLHDMSDIAYVSAEYFDQLVKPLTIEDERILIEDMMRHSIKRDEDSYYGGDYASYFQGFATALIMARHLNELKAENQ